MLFVQAFLLTSCEDFIDLKPLDKISTDDYWKTPNDLEYYTMQFYPSFYNSDNSGSVLKQMVTETALDSDDMLHGGYASNILNGKRSRRTGDWKWEWNKIRNVNIFFENYHKCEDDFSTYKHYVGEAHFFRAWFYFNLLKRYGDVPWYSNVLELDSDEELMRPRDSRTLIADSILADLDKAVSYLDMRSQVGNNRINKEAALAFKTRVALYEGTWQKYHANTVFGSSGANPGKYFNQVVQAAEELMNGNYKVGIYSTNNPDEDYFRLFGLDNMSDVNEVLLYRAFNAADGAGNSVQGFITYNADQKGITWELVSSYLGKDGKPYNYLDLAKTTKGNAFLNKISEDCDPRLKSTIWMPGDLMSQVTGAYFDKPTVNAGSLQLCPTGFQVKKTGNPYSPAAGQSWEIQAETGFIILRYGEVLLNYAEAKCELDGTIALESLNLLRKRAGMSDFSVNLQQSDPNRVDYGYEISDGLYEIRRERRVEMALEGQRDEDYQRWAAHALFKGKRPKGYPVSPEEFPDYPHPVDENGLIDFYKSQLPNGYEFREGQDYLLSIPQDEITLNPNLKQNPGW
jgi:hypothetical protein